MNIGVAVQTESDGPRAEDDARRAELARHLRPYRPALEPVDVVHVAHTHRKGPLHRARGVVVLCLSVAHEPVAVADDEEHAATVDLPLARLLRHAPRDERETVELFELVPAERQNVRVLVLAVLLPRKLVLLLLLPAFLLPPIPVGHRLVVAIICVCGLFGEQRRVVANDYARCERGKL